MTDPASGAGHPAPILSGWRYRAVIWSVLLSVVGYLGFALWGGWRNVVAAVTQVGPLGMAAVLCLSLVNYTLRFVRWQLYLRTMGQSVPHWPSFRIYVAGFALTTTPAKAGEALRSVLLKPWAVPYSTSFTAMLSERLSDIAVIVLLALAGLASYPRMATTLVVGAAAVVGGLLLLSNRSLLERAHGWTDGGGMLSRMARHLVHVLLQARICHTPRMLLLANGLGALAWLAEALAFYLVLHWTGAVVGPMFAISFYAMAMLAGALSFMPGGLGGAEATMMVLLKLMGVGTAESIAATVLIRIATLWFAVCLGLFFLLRLQSAHTAAPVAHAHRADG